MAEVYWGDKRVIGIKPPGGEYINLVKDKVLKGFEVTVPSGTTSLANKAFYLARNLISIHIPDSVTSFGDECFFYCTSLKTIKVPDTVTSFGTNCFCGCTGLTSINIPTSMTSISSNCFYNCKSLPSIVFPPSITSFGGSCFYLCSALHEIYFEGDPPTSTMNGVFSSLSLVIYHKADNPKWTNEIKTSNYGGAASVTWATY